MAETRKLAAILAADVAGYSKLTGADASRSSLNRWTDHFRIVFLSERFHHFCICALTLLHLFFKTSWCHANKQHAWLCSSILESVRCSSWNKHHGMGRRIHDTVTKLNLKLTFHDVKEFVLRFMDVRRWSTFGRDGLTKQA